MARPIKRNRLPIKKLNYTSLEAGIYLDEVAYGEIHKMETQSAEKDTVTEFVYEGNLHHGEVKFITGEKLQNQIPEMEGFNHGYTLEGIANEIFAVENSLDIYSNSEQRTFNYTKKDSKLIFKGDEKKEYSLFVRFYENCYGENNNRWAVIYASEK